MLIVYCGDLWPGSTSKMRVEALQRLGHTVVPVDATPAAAGLRRLFARMAGKLARMAGKARWADDGVQVNQRLLHLVQRHQPQVVWVEKGMNVRPATLRSIREEAGNAHLVHFSLDDMGHTDLQSTQYLRGISLYDLHVTNKSYNVAELKDMGARAVLFVDNAFCPETHRPITVSDEDRSRFGGPVGFIGAFEKERAEAIWFLATHGISVRVWGGWGKGWPKWAASHTSPFLKVEDHAVFLEDYAKAICSFDINLGFLRKVYRDQQTTRSIEIPACGAFMLAERTGEHQRLLEEGAESEFFASHDELLEKTRYYLAHPEARRKISAAGRERCLGSDYSYDRQVGVVLDALCGRVDVRKLPITISPREKQRAS
jgi:spore maturation protein CgeB